MSALIAMLAGTVGAIMLTFKPIVDKWLPESWSEESRAFIYEAIAFVLALGGALIFYTDTPNLFANDTSFIANNPYVALVAAAFISTLPGGLGLPILNLLLGKPTAQSAGKLRSLLLWG